MPAGGGLPGACVCAQGKTVSAIYGTIKGRVLQRGQLVESSGAQGICSSGGEVITCAAAVWVHPVLICMFPLVRAQAYIPHHPFNPLTRAKQRAGAQGQVRPHARRLSRGSTAAVVSVPHGQA